MPATRARRNRAAAEQRPLRLPRGRPGPRGRVRARRRVTFLAGCVLLAASLPGAVGASAGQAQPTVYSGLGFDTCNAPPVSTLQAWLASPYRALGIYIGGANRACTSSQLSTAWVAAVVGMGWALAPLYVGLQAPCSSQSGVARIAPSAAAAQGSAAAADAIAQASALGLPAGSPLYFDMEAYALDDPSCTQTVQTFLSAWVSGLHARGYLAGVYGSAGSTIRDLQALATTAASPDEVWIADWDGDTSVFGDPYVADALWAGHERIHQFSGGHDETYGGVTIDIDGDALDAAVVGSSGATAAPTPPPAPTPTTAPTPAPAPAVPSAAGSVASSDGVASVSWPAGTFAQPVVVSLTPSLPSAPVPGFASGGYGVALAVASTGTGLATTSFADPLTIDISPQPASDLAPVESATGTSWQALPELVGNLLPLGVAAGYAREPNGSIEIATRTAGHFALLPDTTPPPAPSRLSGLFSHGSLVLSWPASSDVAGSAVSYRVSLTNAPLLSVAGLTSAALHTFHSRAPSVYRVRAVDAAGNLSAPSPPLVVLPTPRPAGVPRALPGWAWQLSTWRQEGGIGPRPKAPLPAPAWYWSWRAWHAAPYHLRA